MKSLMIAASVAALAAAAPALAQAQDANKGLYGTLGYSQTANAVDLGAVQGRLGYQMNRWFGVEGELGVGVKSDELNFAPGLDERVRLEHQEAIYGVAFLPITPRFEFLARGGFGNTKVSVDLPQGTTYLNRDTSWNYGAGMQFKFSDRNGIRGDWTREDFRRDGAGHADVWAASFVHKF